MEHVNLDGERFTEIRVAGFLALASPASVWCCITPSFSPQQRVRFRHRQVPMSLRPSDPMDWRAALLCHQRILHRGGRGQSSKHLFGRRVDFSIGAFAESIRRCGSGSFSPSRFSMLSTLSPCPAGLLKQAAVAPTAPMVVLTLAMVGQRHVDGNVAPISVRWTAGEYFPGPGLGRCATKNRFYAVMGLLLLTARRRFFAGGAVGVTALTLGAMVTAKATSVRIDGFFFDGNWLMLRPACWCTGRYSAGRSGSTAPLQAS